MPKGRPYASSEKSGCGVSFGTVRIADFVFADDAVIFAETAEVLAGALDSLREEAHLHTLNRDNKRMQMSPILFTLRAIWLVP